MKSRALAVKTDGSLMPFSSSGSVVLGPVLNTVMTSLLLACCREADDLVWETTFLHGSGRRCGADKEMSCPSSATRLSACP